MGYLRTLCAKAASRRLTQEGISYNQPGLLQWTVSLAFGITLLRVTVIPSLAIRWEATLRDLLFRVGSGSARAVDFSIFSVVLCTPQEFFKRQGEYPHAIAGARKFEMRGQQTTACTFCTAQLEVVLKRNVESNRIF